MAVTVTLRHPFSIHDHAAGQATLVDGRGNLLILDTPDLDLTAEFDEHDRHLFGKPEQQLIQHALATYAEGEWSTVTVDRA